LGEAQLALLLDGDRGSLLGGSAHKGGHAQALNGSGLGEQLLVLGNELQIQPSQYGSGMASHPGDTAIGLDSRPA
jgi:hypothetical protein